ncbi:MAG: acyl-CoA synthetase, partial [Rhodococcus sp. (in: high G+C Gram-positive bacteria)]|nr:acyl-CoA synthetase [Rhodococcus sp. (in: high G+C Gram-positive bacteria)]MDX5455975.1 acyl-CoA synthetase [Rhodococcus sp. (in: high G+C Gram-positive bacteria)]
MTSTVNPGTAATETGVQRATIAEMLLDRVGDDRLGRRTREPDWTWDAVGRASAARGALARSLRGDGPFHIGILLDNVPDFLFWL